MSPLLRENGRTPAAYVGDVNSLFWNFISFPRKPSYSASFLHWIFSLSYPYLTTLYIFNSIISWSSMPSPLRNPWLHQGWTLVSIHREHRTPGEMTGPPTLCFSSAAQALQCVSQNSIRGPAGEEGALISGACQVKPHLHASISSAHTSKLEATASRRSLRSLTSQWMDKSLMCMTQSN